MGEGRTTFTPLIDLLPFWHMEDDGIVVFKDGSLGYGLKIEGVDIVSWPNGQVNYLNENLENLLVSSQEGIRLQLFYKLSHSVSDILQAHRTISKDAPTKYMPIRSARIDFFKQMEEGKNFYRPEIYCFVRSRPHQFSRRRFWESEKQFEQITQGQFEDHKKKFLRSKNQARSSLEHAGLAPRDLRPAEWYKLLFDFFNPERSEKHTLPTMQGKSGPENCFLSHFLFTDLSIYKDHLCLGNFFVRSITLKTLPEGESYAGMMHIFSQSLPFHFAITQNIEICSQKREAEKLRFGRRMAYSMASGAKNLSDLESESQLRHTEELISELIEGSRKIVASDFCITISALSKEELDDKTDHVFRAFQGMNHAEGLAETLPLKSIFLAAAPGVCQGIRTIKMKSDNCAHLMPVYATWKGNQRATCLFEGRSGMPFQYDPFPAELPSWNSLIFASSGSGKSFFVLQMAMQFFGQNPTPRIVWIDNGASCKRLLDESLLDGQFIDLHPDSPICLNMFDLPKGETLPGPSKIKLILAILEQILSEDSQKGLPKKQSAQLEEAIHRVYEESKNTPTLSDLRNFLQKHESSELRDYAQILFSWTGNRAYGRMLDGQTNVDFTKDLVAIEIKGLDTYPDLQNVMLLNFTEFIRSEASCNPGQSTLLIIDEAWKLLETPSGRAFTIEAYRTFRKYGAGIWCISQNYRDFLKDEEISNALFPNTTSTFILKQSQIDREDFQKKLRLNHAEMQTIESLQSVKGEFSEVFLIQNEHKAILQIKSDPLAYYIATSDPIDKMLIEEMKDKNPNKSELEILQILVEQKKKGQR